MSEDAKIILAAALFIGAFVVVIAVCVVDEIRESRWRK